MRGDLIRRAAAVARRLAVEAGTFLLSRLRERRSISHKAGRGNLVTDMDRASERLILRGLRRSFPAHAIVAEESGVSGDAEFRWYVDPLDGTTNYAHGFPLFCVSIAFEVRGRMECGTVYGPALDELYEGIRGGGARRNGRVVRVSRQSRLSDALLCTGFSYDPRIRRRNMKLWNAFLPRAQAVRRVGSAALDLCFTAAGVYDGFWEMSLGPWDVAAAALIAREAGAKVTDFCGGPLDLDKGDVLAANPRLHAAMKAIMLRYNKF
ncbi:MAG: inositol monophosphatase [Planctomycetes bacterium]|nr:inositol monophosphatase [Planctomycetota bacterium]